MVIGTCGFCSTGSSAVSDYLKEFDENRVLDGMEFTIPYRPDGLLDLEYHLVQNPCRDDGSAIAIPRFRHLMKRINRSIHLKYHISEERLQENVDDFIDSIVQFRWHGTNRSDAELNPSKFFYYFGNIIMKGKVIPRINRLAGHCVDMFPYRDLEVSINPVSFDEASKKFVKNLLSFMGADFSQNIVLDQPFMGDDPTISFKFFDNPKAIVVDRDPRDNYLFTIKMLYKSTKYMPVDSVQDFVKYYKLLRNNRPYKNPNDNILLLHFEELVYDYEAATKKVREFCGLGENPRPLSIFDPKISMPNTQLFLRFPEYQEDMRYIEEQLPEYLFHFENYPKPDLSGEMFEGKSPLNKKR